MSFRQSLLNIRNDEINLLMDAHDAELRGIIDQVSVEGLRMELYRQAAQLKSHVEATFRISVRDFFNRNSTLLKLKNVWADAEATHEFYTRYPLVIMMLERLRAEFTSMLVVFGVTFTGEFVVRVSGTLALPRDETPARDDCSQHDGWQS